MTGFIVFNVIAALISVGGLWLASRPTARKDWSGCDRILQSLTTIDRCLK
jgi:hypothetical protein